MTPDGVGIRGKNKTMNEELPKQEPKIEKIKTMELTELEWQTVLDGLDALDEFFTNELPSDPKGREAIRILIEKIKGELK